MRRLGWPLVVIVIILGLFAVVGFLTDSTSKKTAKLADFAMVSGDKTNFGTVVDSAGKTVNLDDLISKSGVMLTFWNDKCPDCSSLIPVLEARNINNFQKIYVHIGVKSSDGDDPTAGKTYFDKDSVIYKQENMAIPSTFIVENGVVKYYFPGKISADLLDQLAKHYQ